MEQGYKHFSHSHNLIIHQLPEGVDVSCSGCNSSGGGTVYICWQCNFFLHEQCYRATRSLKHPSHPPHPLTLVPYPTYPSNSFYCNSCEIIGTGFSYSCATCDFDLHVQCAYSIFRATSFQKTHQYPTTYYIHDQELVPPSWNGQNSSMAQTVPDSLQTPFTAAQNPYANSLSNPNPITSDQYHSTGHETHDLAYVSIPPYQNAHSVSISTSLQYPITSSMDQNGHFVPIPASLQNPVTSAQYSSVSESGPSVSVISQNSITGTQYLSMTQHTPSSSSIPSCPPIFVSSIGDPSNPQNGPSASIPVTSLNPVTSPPQYSSLPATSVSIPTQNQNSITSDQKSNIASVPVPVPAASPDNHVESGQNQMNNKGIMHFSHPHNLHMVKLEDKEDEVVCSGCEDTLDGKCCYSCVEPNCDFHLHESCFELKREIQHKSHPQHPLTLLPLAPYKNENGEFTCNACSSDGTGFTYHCSICTFDLHIQCVSLPETVKRSDHEHMLKLFYSCPVKDEGYRFFCDVCHVGVEKDRWTYYCESCDYGTHLGCVDCEECIGDSVVDATAQLQRLQLQMEMSRQNAQMLASMGASLVNLV